MGSSAARRVSLCGGGATATVIRCGITMTVANGGAARACVWSRFCVFGGVACVPWWQDFLIAAAFGLFPRETRGYVVSSDIG